MFSLPSRRWILKSLLGSLSDARQPEVDFLHTWAVILKKRLDKSSL